MAYHMISIRRFTPHEVAAAQLSSIYIETLNPNVIASLQELIPTGPQTNPGFRAGIATWPSLQTPRNDKLL